MTEENKDQDDQKNKDQQNQDDLKKKEEPEVDPRIAEIMKDPDAVSELLKKKRDANAEAKKYREDLEAIKKKQQEAEDEALKEQGKFKELAEKAQNEKAEAEAKFIKKAKLNALQIEAIKQVVIDPEVVGLVNLEEVKIDNDFNVSNAEEVIKAFKEKKPHLFKEEEDSNTTPAPDNPKPGLRQKIVATQEGLNPRERISRGLNQTK